jgi:flavin-dependent dehydrogenase
VDVAVLGAGPAGTAAALALRAADRSVVLLEGNGFGAPRVGETLAPSVRPLLNALGVWEAVRSICQPSGAVEFCWGEAGVREQSHLFHPHGAAHLVERSRFDQLLAQAAVGAGALLWGPGRLLSLGGGPGAWELCWEQEGRPFNLVTRFLIDAAGRRAPLARQLGARRIFLDRQVGMWALWGGASARPTTLVESVEQGWWYAAALPGGGLSTVLLTDPDLLQRRTPQIACGNPSRVVELLGRTCHIAARTKGRSLAGKLAVVAANSSCLDCPGGAGWLAAGDAALSVDPLSGHGIFLALESGRRVGLCADRWLSGDGQALDTHFEATAARRIWLQQGQLRLYQAEDRWPGAPFWARRHSVLPPGNVALEAAPSVETNNEQSPAACRASLAEVVENRHGERK